MFADRSEWLGDNPPFKGYGAAVTAGPNGSMVFVTGFGCANRLLCFENGRLVDRSCGILADPTRGAIGVAAADLDADGSEELYVHNTNAYAGYTDNTDLLLDRIEHDGRSVWCDAFGLDVNAERGNFHAGRSVAAVDRLGTGRYGMVVASYDAPMRCYELGDDGEITDMAEAVGLDSTCGGRSLVTAPLVSDAMDVFVGVERGPNRLFRNDDGHFTDCAAELGIDAPDSDARGTALVDVGDRGFALALGSWEDENRLFVPTDPAQAENEPRAFVDRAPPEFAEPTQVRTVVAADFDNDGRQELFVNVLGSENRLFAPVWGDGDDDVAGDSGDNRFAGTGGDALGFESRPLGDAVEPRGLGTGAVVADINRDGTLELLVVHGEADAQPLSLYTVPNDNGWLRVAPTTQHGAPARGAIVTLETDRGRQRRVIDAGSSYLCQSEPVAQFGLGGDTAPRQRPERLTVRWLDGREVTVNAPASETTHRLGHPTVE